MDTTGQQNASPSMPQDSSQSAQVNNGDIPKTNGDAPIASPDSIQQVINEQSDDTVKVAKVNDSEVVTNINSGITSSAAGVQKEESSDQIRKLGESIEKIVLPDELRKTINDRIARLALIRSGAGFMSSTYIIEYESTSRYINWVVGLPWDKKTEDNLDLVKARQIMDKNHYGLEMLKERMLEYIASVMLNVKNNGPEFIARAPILCFVGLAGTGKTTFAKSMADVLSRSFERIPFGGMADSRILRGQSRFFPDAEPGQIVKRLVHAGSNNPVILLDELDRVTDAARGDIMGVLIELLDPEQNAAFADHYIDFPFNLQSCLFVATANNTTAVSTAVLDRLEIVQMPSYNDEEKTVIGKNFVLPKAKKIVGLREDQLIVDDTVWEPIIRPLGFDPGVRGLDRLITNMCRKAAMIIISGQADTVRITSENVKDFLPI